MWNCLDFGVHDSSERAVEILDKSWNTEKWGELKGLYHGELPNFGKKNKTSLLFIKQLCFQQFWETPFTLKTN